MGGGAAHPDGLARRPLNGQNPARETHLDGALHELAADRRQRRGTGAGAAGLGQTRTALPDAQADGAVLKAGHVYVDAFREEWILLDLRAEPVERHAVRVG